MTKQFYSMLFGFALLLAMALGATAQSDDAGWIRAQIEGETMEWRLDPQQSDWFGPLEGPNTFTSVYSRLSQDGPLPSRIGISVYRGPNGWYAEGMDIYLMGSGFYTTGNGDGDVKAAVTEAFLDGTIMVIKGSFAAALPFQQDFTTEPDMTKILAITEAEFELRLPPRQ